MNLSKDKNDKLITLKERSYLRSWCNYLTKKCVLTNGEYNEIMSLLTDIDERIRKRGGKI